MKNTVGSDYEITHTEFGLMLSLVLLINKPIYKQVIKVEIKELDQGVLFSEL